MSVPGFTAEASLYRIRTNFGSIGSHGSLLAAGAVVPQLQALGCGECTPLTWPDGTKTGACRRACCDWFGCRTESCPCGGGSGIFGGGWGGFFGGARIST
jgi:hypothetical protein